MALDVKRELETETAAVQLLLAHYRDLTEGDEDFASTLIEGESTFYEIADRIISEIGELDDYADALAAKIKAVQARKARFEERSKCLRAALASALDVCQQKSLKRPEATVTVGVGPQTVEVVEEANIPFAYWIPQPPKLDKRLALEQMKAGTIIDGITLADGKPKITIRRS